MVATREAVIRIVRAARTARKMAQAIESLIFETKVTTAPDQVFGELADALFAMSGEVVRFDQDFEKDSKTMKILLSEELADDEAADEFIRMAWENASPEPPKKTWLEPMKEQVRKTGGYCPETGYVPPKEIDETPEGEWR
jgi:hypothetical protein